MDAVEDGLLVFFEKVRPPATFAASMHSSISRCASLRGAGTILRDPSLVLEFDRELHAVEVDRAAPLAPGEQHLVHRIEFREAAAARRAALASTGF